MKTFLGVPVTVAGQPFGNLYLAEKAGGEPFTEADEETVVLVAGFAGMAIDHARRYSGFASRHDEVRCTVDALDATVEIARVLGGDTDLGVIFELIANRGLGHRCPPAPW